MPGLKECVKRWWKFIDVLIVTGFMLMNLLSVEMYSSFSSEYQKLSHSSFELNYDWEPDVWLTCHLRFSVGVFIELDIFLEIILMAAACPNQVKLVTWVTTKSFWDNVFWLQYIILTDLKNTSSLYIIDRLSTNCNNFSSVETRSNLFTSVPPVGLFCSHFLEVISHDVEHIILLNVGILVIVRYYILIWDEFRSFESTDVFPISYH